MDVFCSLDGYGSAGGDWGGYWGKKGQELLDHRLALYQQKQRMSFGATTYRAFAKMPLAASLALGLAIVFAALFIWKLSRRAYLDERGPIAAQD